MGKQKYSKDDYDFIIKNYNCKTSTEIANIVGCSRQLVLKIWRENGLKGKDKSRQFYGNFNYFNKINTRNKAYIIGLLVSDGCLFKRKNHQGSIRLSLHKNDVELLESINKELIYNKPLEFIDDYCTITINSDIMYNDLIKIGLYDNKTHTIDSKYINIEKDFELDYVRGYFDGDGSIFISKPKTNQNITPTCYNLSISGYTHNLESIQFILSRNNIDTQITIDKRSYSGNFNFGALRFGSNKSKYFFLKSIYKNNDEIIFMNRKYNVAKNFIEMIEDNISNKSKNINIVKEYISIT